MSNKTYCQIELKEMQEILNADKGWRLAVEPRSREYFFEFPLKTSPWIVIKVASSITADGLSRNCGEDAIRVFAVDENKKKGFISTKRVNRIGTWRKNLKASVMECFENARIRRMQVYQQ
jgi:hypothetical protein